MLGMQGKCPGHLPIVSPGWQEFPSEKRKRVSTRLMPED